MSNDSDRRHDAARRQTCSRSKPGWVCLRDAGHDGPCAAAPVTGAGACPHIDFCMDCGCQAKCGPKDRSDTIVRFKAVRYAAYAGISLVWLLTGVKDSVLVVARHWVKHAKHFAASVRFVEDSWAPGEQDSDWPDTSADEAWL